MDELIELLPLPSVLLNWPHPTNHAAIRDYARACVTHATAAQDAEIERLKVVAHGFVDEIAARETKIEALRAEVERLTGCLATANANHEQFERKWYLAQDRADKLEEALRGWWEARRPVSWTEDQHRSCPHVNLVTDAEEALATALLRDHDSKYEHEEDTNDR